jgi:ATP-binding cassette subfamily B protein
MVAKHCGRSLSAQELREAAEIGKDGVNMLGIAQAAERVGFKRFMAISVVQPCLFHQFKKAVVLMSFYNSQTHTQAMRKLRPVYCCLLPT